MSAKIKSIFLQKHYAHIDTLALDEIEGYTRAVSMSVLSSEIRAALYEKIDERSKVLGLHDTENSLVVSSEFRGDDL